jgi:hypothetical protein
VEEVQLYSLLKKKGVQSTFCKEIVQSVEKKEVNKLELVIRSLELVFNGSNTFKTYSCSIAHVIMGKEKL